MRIEAILTDIEGTTSSLSFVHEVLFPYARRTLPGFVAAHAQEPPVRALLDEARQLAGPDSRLSDSGIVAQLQAWIDEDRKIGPLKALQGLVWEEGYRSGAFQGHVYNDAVAALGAWRKRGLRLYVFSSGSVQAQQLLFRHTAHGDLTPWFDGYFDTRIGAKRESGSYQNIVAALSMEPASVLFLSDIEAELDAAAAAGLATVLVDRGGAHAGNGSRHRRIAQLTELGL